MAGDEVPPQQSIRTIELPSYPPFSEHSPFPRYAMAENLVHCGIESGPKQNNGC